MPSSPPTSADVIGFFDTATSSVSYIVSDPQTQSCAIVDAVLDYDPNGRAVQWETTVKAQRANVHIDGASQADYVAMRTARDKTLALPALILPAVQVNIRAGNMPPPESNGVSYLKIPLDRF